jgi:hypothetical protein
MGKGQSGETAESQVRKRATSEIKEAEVVMIESEGRRKSR